MSTVLSITAATLAYERWLGERIDPVGSDLALKHALMSQSLPSFLRGTYYHWAFLWPQVCPKLSSAPKLLAVGDVHLANFGTWRDAEGRLVWGVNDLDEAAKMPYAADLVRLATSALVGRREGTLALSGTHVIEAIIEGYPAASTREGRHLCWRSRTQSCASWRCRRSANRRDSGPSSEHSHPRARRDPYAAY